MKITTLGPVYILAMLLAVAAHAQTIVVRVSGTVIDSDFHDVSPGDSAGFTFTFNHSPDFQNVGATAGLYDFYSQPSQFTIGSHAFTMPGTRVFVIDRALTELEDNRDRYIFQGYLQGGGETIQDGALINNSTTLAVELDSLPEHDLFTGHSLDQIFTIPVSEFDLTPANFAFTAQAVGGGFVGAIINVDSFTVSAVPEPSTYAFCAGAGMLGVALWRRQRGRSRAWPVRSRW